MSPAPKPLPWTPSAAGAPGPARPAAPAGAPDRCPRLVRVQGHPVFVAPEFAGNCFYVDGAYWWLPADGEWRHSPHFDGPWACVGPDLVPPALLRLPFSAYHAPPARLGAGEPYRPPRWDLIWGADWARRHPGWARRDLDLHEHPTPRPPAQQAEELLRGATRRPAQPTDFSHPEEHP